VTSKTIKIEVITDRPPEFYELMGYYLSHRKIRREMPYLIDDDGYVWFVALQDWNVAGFASLHVDKKNEGHLHGLYVVPEHRENGLASRLVKERLAWLKKQGVAVAHTTATQNSVDLLLKCGFGITGAKGTYTQMEIRL